MCADITEMDIILDIMEIESGRELIGREIDPNDTNGGYTGPEFDGHHTNWGVTEETLQSLGMDIHPRMLTFSQAARVYREAYYKKCGAHLIYNLHPDLAHFVFSVAVNMGVSVAARRLQVILNINNNRQILYPDSVVDGHFGKKSYDALQAYILKRRGEGKDNLMVDYLIAAGSFYQDLATNKEKYEKFYFGWINRIKSTLFGYLAKKESSM